MGELNLIGILIGIAIGVFICGILIIVSIEPIDKFLGWITDKLWK